jgi:dTMP kinase
MADGFLIVIDGGDGAGKGTCISKLNEYLQGHAIDVMLTREPGGTAIGERIRELLLDNSASEMTSTTELLLFAAARSQHVEQKIIPAINSGKIVISDRFSSATISFQHYGRGLPLQLINDLNSIALAGLEPRITIILDLDPVVGLQRISKRGGGSDRIEEENIEFLRRARNGFLEQAKRCPDKFLIIDANLPEMDVFGKVREVIDDIINHR